MGEAVGGEGGEGEEGGEVEAQLEPVRKQAREPVRKQAREPAVSREQPEEPEERAGAASKGRRGTPSSIPWPKRVK